MANGITPNWGPGAAGFTPDPTSSPAMPPQSPTSIGGAASGQTDINSAFTQFVNANPQYASGGQAAIDAFGQKYPQYAGVIAWDPNRQVYESQGGYFTNLPGNPQGGWSLTPSGPDSGSGGGTVGGFGTFTPPTAEQAAGTPGFQFSFDQGQRAVQTGAAAKGDLLTGGTLKDLAQFGTGLASTTYQNTFKNALDTHNTQYGDLYNLAKLGQPAA